MDLKRISSKKRRYAETVECKHPQLNTCSARNVRRRVSPASRSNSSRSSTPSVSEASALFSTDLSSSTRGVEDDSDTETTLSSSSEDTSSGSDSDSGEDDDDEMENTSDAEMYESESEVETLRVGIKPSIQPPALQDAADAGQPPLLERLKGFLPQLAAANQSLDEERAGGVLMNRDLETVNEEDGEGYIEMSLGLGVLEEKDPTADSSSSSGDDSSDEDEQGASAAREKDVLGKLMGQKRRGDGAHIQEVGNE